jgi:hypothetical protein
MLTPVDLDATSNFVTPCVRKKERAKRRYQSESDDDVPRVSRKKRSTECSPASRKKAPPPPPADELIVVDDVVDDSDNANENGIVEIDSQVLPKTDDFGRYSDNEHQAEEDGDKSDGGETAEVERNQQSPNLLADDSSESS